MWVSCVEDVRATSEYVASMSALHISYPLAAQGLFMKQEKIGRIEQLAPQEGRKEEMEKRQGLKPTENTDNLQEITREQRQR